MHHPGPCEAGKEPGKSRGKAGRKPAGVRWDVAKNSTKRRAAAAPETTDGRPAPGGAPLFEEIDPEWAYISVERLEPIEERGYLGQVPVDVTAETLRSMFGGGRFVLRAKTADHQIKQNRTLEIAGDPVFISDDAEQRYKRRTQGRAAASSAAPAPAAPGAGLGELVTIMQMMQSQNQQLLQQQLEAQREERRRQADEDKRREEQRRAEDDRKEERRRQEAKAEEERRREEAKAERDRQREHTQAMLQLVTSQQKGGGDQVNAFTQGIALALKLAGGKGGDQDDDDDDDEVVDQDPVMATIRAGVQGLIDGLKGNKAETPAPAASSASSSAEDVTITGPLAKLVKDLDQEAKSAGRDTDELLAGAVNVLRKTLKKKNKAAASSSSSSSSPSSEATVTDLDAARRAAAAKVQQAAEATKPDAPAS